MPEKLTKAREADLFHRMQRQGDTQARDVLIILHSGLVHLLATRLCGAWASWAWQEELITIGFEELIKAVDDDKFSISLGWRFSTYAYNRIKFRMLDFLRKKKEAIAAPHESLSEQQGEEGREKVRNVPDAALSPYEQLVQKEYDLLALLPRAIAKLDERRRIAITLHHLEGKSLKEIADHMNEKESTIKSLLFRGREELRLHLTTPLTAAPTNSVKEVNQNA